MFKRKHNCCGKHFKTGDEIDNNTIINKIQNTNSNNTYSNNTSIDSKNNNLNNPNSKKTIFKKANTSYTSNTYSTDANSNVTDIINNISSLRSINFKAYIGKTVTVYVNGGGISGSGFTGVLLESDEVVIRLLTQPASAPACALGGACDTYIKAPILCAVCPNAQQFNLGVVVEIPIWNIVAFVHNAIEIF